MRKNEKNKKQKLPGKRGQVFKKIKAEKNLIYKSGKNAEKRQKCTDINVFFEFLFLKFAKSEKTIRRFLFFHYSIFRQRFFKLIN